MYTFLDTAWISNPAYLVTVPVNWLHRAMKCNVTAIWQEHILSWTHPSIEVQVMHVPSQTPAVTRHVRPERMAWNETQARTDTGSISCVVPQRSR